jgi:hypothetical protein
VVAVLEAPPVELRTDDRLTLPVHVVSDLRTAIEDLTVTVTLSWLSDPERVLHRAGWTGRVGPDDVVRVGTLRVTVPEPAGGSDTLAIEVQLRGATIATNLRTHHRLVRR